VLSTRGHAFVLFTSYEMMNDMAERLAGTFKDNGLNLMVQGSGTPRTAMLDRFRNERARSFSARTASGRVWMSPATRSST